LIQGYDFLESRKDETANMFFPSSKLQISVP